MTEPLWTLSALADAAGAPRPPQDAAITSLSIDTRTLAPGALFVALNAARDGHDFVPDAFARGAAAALVHRHDPAWSADWPLIAVADTQAGLEGLGRAARERCQATRIGITGSVGKTTTKEALALILGAQAPTHAAAGSYNNHWGVPLTLARMPAASRYGVFEMGMNAAGEIADLSPQVAPHIAVVSMVAPVHLEALGSIEAIAHAKAEIFGGIVAGGTAVWNADLDTAPILEAAAKASTAARHVRLGRSPGCEARLLAVSPLASGGAEITLDLFGQRLTGPIQLPPNPHAHTALVAMTLAVLAGADPQQAMASLATMPPVGGRGARRTVPMPGGGDLVLIDESYNASPPAMAAALATLVTVPTAGRRIAVLGDMLELGDAAPALHADIAQHVTGQPIDRVITAGPHMRFCQAALDPSQQGGHHGDSAAAAEAVAAIVQPGDVVMVKGSAGMKMGAVIRALEHLTTPTASPS